MKIAIICSSFFPVIDGVTIAVFNRLEQLCKLGHQAIVFCPDYQPLAHIYLNYPDYMGEVFPGIKIINLPSTKSIALDFERDVTTNSYKIVVKKLAEFKPDIIHVDEAERLGVSLLKVPGVRYAKQNNIPCVAWFHTNYLDYFDDYFSLPFNLNKLVKRSLGLIFAKIYNSYDLTLVSSSVTAERIAKLGIKNIHYSDLLGCDLDSFEGVKNLEYFTKQYNLPDLETKIKLIFIGRLTPDKGWYFTLRSLPLLPVNIWDKIAIIIAGDGTLKEEIESNLKQLTPHVYLLGRVDPKAVPELLINSDIFVTNSEKETRGLTVIEAAAAGIPAIAPAAGGIIDTIKNGETGWLYQPQDREDFIDKLALLSEDSSLRKSMGDKAKELSRRWSWEKSINNLVAIWSQEIERLKSTDGEAKSISYIEKRKI